MRTSLLVIVVGMLSLLTGCSSDAPNETSASEGVAPTSIPRETSLPVDSGVSTPDSAGDGTVLSEFPTVVVRGVHAVLPSVENRVDATDARCPGINFVEGVLEVSVNESQGFEISAGDWNTIGAESSVSPQVATSYDEVVTHDECTTRRFEYLSALLAAFSPATFLPTGIVSSHLIDGPYVLIAAFQNPNSTDCELSGLDVSIVSKPSGIVVATGRFFEPAAALVVDANSTYFGELNLGAARDAPTSDTSISYSFRWESLRAADSDESCDAPESSTG